MPNNTRLVQQTRRDGHRQGYHRKAYETQSAKADRDALRAERAKVTPGDWSVQNTAPEFVPETLWGRLKREWASLRAHCRDWSARASGWLAVAPIEVEARLRKTPKPMTGAERARFIADGEVWRKTLEWRRKTNRNMLTGEHLSGMAIDRFEEFPEGNPYEEGENCVLKWGRQPLDVEEGRPHEPSKFDPVTRKYKGRLAKDADQYRDPHGRDADGWVEMEDGRQVHCGTGSIFGPDGRTRINRFTRDEHFRKVVLEGLTPEEAAAHRAEEEAFKVKLHIDAKERRLAEQQTARWA